MDKIKLKVGDRVRIIRTDQAEEFFNPRKPTPQEKKFIEAYLAGNMRNSGKAYAVAYPRSAAWPQAKRLKAAKALFRRPAVHKALNDRIRDLVRPFLGANCAGQD